MNPKTTPPAATAVVATFAQIAARLPALMLYLHTCTLNDITYYVIGEDHYQKRSIDEVKQVAALIADIVNQRGMTLFLERQLSADTKMHIEIADENKYSLLMRLFHHSDDLPRTLFDIRALVAPMFHPTTGCVDSAVLVLTLWDNLLRTTNMPAARRIICDSYVGLLRTMVVMPVGIFLTTHVFGDSESATEAAELNSELNESFRQYVVCVDAANRVVDKTFGDAALRDMLSAVDTYAQKTRELADVAAAIDKNIVLLRDTLGASAAKNTEDTRKSALHAATVRTAENKTYRDEHTPTGNAATLDELIRRANELLVCMIFAIPAKITDMHLKRLIRANTAQNNIVCAGKAHADNIVAYLRDRLHYTITSTSVSTVEYRENITIKPGVRYRPGRTYVSTTAEIPAIMEQVVKGTTCINITECIRRYRSARRHLPASVRHSIRVDARAAFGCAAAVYDSVLVCALGDPDKTTTNNTTWRIMVVQGDTAYTIQNTRSAIIRTADEDDEVRDAINELYLTDTAHSERALRKVTKSRALTFFSGREDDPSLNVYQTAAIVSQLIHSDTAMSNLRSHTTEHKVALLGQKLKHALKLSDSDIRNLGALFFTEYIRKVGTSNDTDVEEDPPLCTF